MASPQEESSHSEAASKAQGELETETPPAGPPASPGPGLEEEKMSPDISCGQKRRWREREERIWKDRELAEEIQDKGERGTGLGRSILIYFNLKREGEKTPREGRQ